ncbi:MAG: hypothetical protein J6A01_05670 [Proteobacteria bacterium]|nr:hypothetical protein [Pseudomonadota bacterium]
MDVTEKQYQSWDLTEKDVDKLKTLLENSGKYEALEMKQAMAEGFSGWWNGTFYNDQIICVAYITKQFVYLYGRDREPMMHLGKSLARSQGKRSGGATHSVFGPNDMVRAFWQGFQMTEKSVITDVQLNLYELTEIACKQNDAYAVRYANKKDLPLVFDFYGEALIDELGMDVRRMSKDAHEKNCAQLIEAGSIILGFHRGKPAFVCKFSETPVGIFLDNAHFPVAMRRPKVMRGIHARTAELLLEKQPAVLMYLDANDADTQAALDEVGYRTVNASRLMRLR